MTQDESVVAVRTTLAVLARLAATTRTQADDLLLQLLHANETKLARAVQELANDATQPPPAERITAALAQVGIRG